MGSYFSSRATQRSFRNFITSCITGEQAVCADVYLDSENVSIWKYGIRKYLNQSAAEQIIHAFVTSRLDNGNALFYGLPQNQISHLQHIQNTAARVVTLSRKSCHITPILKELHWLPVSQRIVFKLMLIVHKSVNNIAPIHISELLKVYTPSRNLRSSNMSLLKEPTSKRTWGDRYFSVAAPRLWNHLPTKLKSCHSITRFKSLLKTHLMSQFCKDDVYL